MSSINMVLSLLTMSPSHSTTPQPSNLHQTETNSTLKYLLWYQCVTKEVDNQCVESYTLDQAGYANIGFTSNITTMVQGDTKGIKSLFSIHDTFFVNGKGLRPDWKDAWASAKTQLEPLAANKTLAGFFVGDELFPGKISVDDFKTALGALSEMKDKYPHLISWENEGGTSWIKYFQDGGIPDELDIISLDDYYLSVDEHRQFYEKSIYPLLKPHQSVWLVPGAYATNGTSDWIKASPWCCGGTTVDACDKCMVNRTQAFVNWAMEDDKVSGIAAWHWDTRTKPEVSQYKEIGVQDMPKLKESYGGIYKSLSPLQ